MTSRTERSEAFTVLGVWLVIAACVATALLAQACTDAVSPASAWAEREHPDQAQWQHGDGAK